MNETMSNKKGFGKDLLTAAKYCVILSAVSAVLLLAGGYLFGGFSLGQALNVCRSGLCIISGLSLFLVAGAILTRRNEMIKDDSQWRKKFARLGYIGVLIIASCFFILFASLADAALRLLI